ncbi:hypothetical protein V6N13_057022 [Hibiscus sabdariffa]
MAHRGNNGQNLVEEQDPPSPAIRQNPLAPGDGVIIPPIPHNNQQQPVRTARDYLAEYLEGLNPVVTIPEFKAEHFELKPVMFSILNTLGQFGGFTCREHQITPQVILRDLQLLQDSWSLQRCLETKVISLFTEG